MTRTESFASWEDAVRWLRQQSDSADLVRDAYYDDPLLEAAMRYWRSEEWAATRLFLPSVPGRALDVGAGRGIASFALAKEGFDVISLEPDGSALVGTVAIESLARETGLPITVVQEVSERLPFPNASFEVVFARAVLHHTHDLRAACGEFLRVLKPGGRLIAVREHVISKHADLPRFLETHPLHRLYGGENAFLLAEYISAIKGAGFTLDRIVSPFDSAINFAPHTSESIKKALSARLVPRIPVLQRILRRCLAVPVCWQAVVSLANRFHRRPGRLYSFVATRP